jgi:tRNA pseudouridine55 synthase
MDGVLVIDKPTGLTSHDVVATARRALRESRVGHTGTLDPLATGVLPLALGRATRLVRFLIASDKEYEAIIRFGVTTDTYDITGAETGRSNRAPARRALIEAIDALRGEYPQMPPAYSAKKVDGHRAYERARRDENMTLKPAMVRATRVELIEADGTLARVAITCSAGFYVRSFAHTLGERVGTGACLEALRRLRSGDFSIEAAIGVDGLFDASRVSAGLIELDQLLPGLPAVTVGERGRSYVAHGRMLDPGDFQPSLPTPLALPTSPARWFRILDLGGALVGLGTEGRARGSLHPALVLI